MSDYSMLLARIAELESAPHPAAVAPDVVAERDALKAANAKLDEDAAHAQVSVQKLMAENEALRAQIEAFKAAVTAEVQHAETLVPQA